MEKGNFSHFPNFKMVIKNYCDEITYLKKIIIFFINPFAQLDNDVADKIATYFDISNKEDLELEIIYLDIFFDDFFFFFFLVLTAPPSIRPTSRH